MKTLLTPAGQLDKTLGLAVDYFAERNAWVDAEDRLYEHLFVGLMLRSTRLLCAGDFIVFYFDNGQASRWKSVAVSSKGYRIVDYYVHFNATRNTSFRWSRGHYRVRRPVPKEHKISSPRRSVNAAIIKEESGQPIKFLKVLETWSVDPTTQACVLERLRTGAVVMPVGSCIRQQLFS